MDTKGFFQFEIIINGLVTFVLLIWTPMLWDYGHYTYFLLFQCEACLYTSESDVCSSQILTYKDGPRAERVKYKRFSDANICEWG